MTESTLELARRGDDDAFRALTDAYRRELHVHCYRILGSLQDAEDMVQETLLAAWRGLERYEDRDSMRAWLYRIATNRCLNALRDSRRREVPVLPFELPRRPDRASRCGSSRTRTRCSPSSPRPRRAGGAATRPRRP